MNTRKFLATILAVGIAANVHADIAYTAAGAVTGGAAGTLNIGREFTVAAPGIVVSDLGVYDDGANGLASAHDVTLFSITGTGNNPAPETQLATVNVPSGTGATLDSGFRFASIAPLTLLVGNYAIVAYGLSSTGDPYGDGGGVPAGPAVTNAGFDPYQFTNATTPSFPNNGDVNDHSSASFHFAVVPEPASVTLLGIGFLCVAGRRKRAALEIRATSAS